MERQLIAGACFLAALASWAPVCHAQTPGVDYPYGDGVVYRREVLFGSFAGGDQDGPAAEFESFDSLRARAPVSGNWYLLDEVNALAIKKYDVAKNRITTIAWGGPYGKLGGLAEAARFAGGGYANNMGLSVDEAEQFLTVFDHSNGDIYWRVDLVTGMVDPAPGPTQAAGASVVGWGAGGVLYYAMSDGLLKKVLPDGTTQSLGVTLEQPLQINSFYKNVVVSEKMGRLYAFSRDFRDGPWGMVWYWDMTTGRGVFVAGPKPGEVEGPLASGPANAVSFWGQSGLNVGPDLGERYVYCGGGDEPTPSRVDLQRSYVHKLVKADATDPSLWTWGEGRHQVDFKFLDPYNWSAVPAYNSKNGEFYMPWALASRVEVYRPLTGTVQPVTITTQPANQTVASGQTATFSVVASGTAPLTYQWQKNGVDIAGATSASHTTPATAAADSGSTYRVIVTNAAGSVTSSAATLTVTAPVAPTISTQPSNQTVMVGQTASFSIVAGGSPPFSYQWQKNGVDIAGATASAYTTPVTVLGDSGAAFRVVVTNGVGSATSNAATLTVTAPVAPAITTQPSNQGVVAGQKATFTVVSSGTTPLSYQWRRNGADIAGATSASYMTPPTTVADDGAAFSVTVSNSAGSTTSSSATLTVATAGATVWVEDALPPGAVPAADGGDAWTWISASPAPFSGAAASQSNIASGEHQHFFTGATQTLSVGTGDRLFAYVYLDPANPPTEVMLQWNDGSGWEHRAYWGANSLVWGTDGTASRLRMGALPATGQWVRLEVPASLVGLEGAVLSGMAFTLYDGRATWDYAGVLSGASGPGAPVITAQPSDQTVSAGQTATFGVTASGTSPLSYQWQKNGTDIAGATSASYTTLATTAADNGSTYRVVVTNGAGSVTSTPATLTVTTAATAPSITTQPVNQTVTEGQTATFSVVASGTALLSYQWQRNGADIAGATSASYTTTATATADSGSTYRVIVSNSAGSVTSSAATLTVTAASVDSDADGLPDAWEQTHFGGLGQAGGGDPDGDGADNLSEFQAGTDPVDPASRPATGLPLPWVHQDVGAVGAAGTASYATSVFTVQGSGEDVWNTADAFHFVYQTLSGDGEIVARVSTQQNTNAWAKAGVMVRESLAAGSANAFIAVTPGNGVRFQYRLSAGNPTDAVAGTASTAPYWLKMVRVGAQLTGHASADGTNWVAIGSQAVSMGTSVYVGLAVVSSVPNVLNTSTFDNVSVTAGGGGGADSDGDGLPDAWEITHFGSLSQTASGDPDGDGANNLDEFLVGTDPMDPSSAPGPGTGTAPAGGRDNPNGGGCFASVAVGSGGGAWILALALFCGLLSCVPNPRERRLSAGTKER